MPELKKKIKFIIDRFSMIYEFWRDYCNYKSSTGIENAASDPYD